MRPPSAPACPRPPSGPSVTCVSSFDSAAFHRLRLRFGDLRQQASIRPRFTGSTLVAPMSSRPTTSSSSYEATAETQRAIRVPPPLRACGLRISLSALRFDQAFQCAFHIPLPAREARLRPAGTQPSAENNPHREKHLDDTCGAKKTRSILFRESQRELYPCIFPVGRIAVRLRTFLGPREQRATPAKQNRTTA